MTRKQTLDEAARCVCTEREEQYGSPESNFATIAALWEVYLRRKCVSDGADVCLLAEDVSALLALLKIGRVAGGQTKADNWVDLAGYAACGCELQTDGFGQAECKNKTSGKSESNSKAMKLYCVKNSEISWVRNSLTKGNIYEFDGHRINYDNGDSAYFANYEAWRRGDPNYAACLVPLVSRRAKPGEWVLVTDKVDGHHLPECHAGDVLRVEVESEYTYGAVVTTSENVLQQHEYLVLDRYKPDEESEG